MSFCKYVGKKLLIRRQSIGNATMKKRPKCDTAASQGAKALIVRFGQIR